MLGDISKTEHIYITVGYTDMRNYENLLLMGSFLKFGCHKQHFIL